MLIDYDKQINYIAESTEEYNHIRSSDMRTYYAAFARYIHKVKAIEKQKNKKNG